VCFFISQPCSEPRPRLDGAALASCVGGAATGRGGYEWSEAEGCDDLSSVSAVDSRPFFFFVERPKEAVRTSLPSLLLLTGRPPDPSSATAERTLARSLVSDEWVLPRDLGLRPKDVTRFRVLLMPCPDQWVVSKLRAPQMDKILAL